MKLILEIALSAAAAALAAAIPYGDPLRLLIRSMAGSGAPMVAAMAAFALAAFVAVSFDALRGVRSVRQRTKLNAASSAPHSAEIFADTVFAPLAARPLPWRASRRDFRRIYLKRLLLVEACGIAPLSIGALTAMSYHFIDRGVWPLWVLLLLLYAIGMAWLILDEAPSRLIAVLAPASSADAIPSPRPDIDQRLPAPSSATGASPPEGLERVTGAVDRLRAKLETAPDLSLKMDEGIARLRAYLGGLLGQLDEKLVTTLEASRQAAPAKTDPDLALKMDEGLARFRAEFGGILRRLDEKLTAAIVVSRQAPPSEAGPDLALKLDDGLARLRTELASILGPLDERLAAAVAASRQAAPSETGPDLALKIDEGLGRLRTELAGILGPLDEKLAAAVAASRQAAPSETGPDLALKLDEGLGRLRTELAGILGPLDEKLAAAVTASRQETGPDLALKLDEGLGRLRAELGDVVGQLDQKLAGAASQQTASQQMAVSELGTGVAALTNAVLELERAVRGLSDDQAGLRRDVLEIGTQLREMPVPAPADTAPGRAVTVFEPRTIADELQDLLDEVAEADSVPTLTPRFARSGDRS